MLFDFYLRSSEGLEIFWRGVNSVHGREPESPQEKQSPERTYKALAKKLKGTGSRLTLFKRPAGSPDFIPWEVVENLRLELPEF